MDQYPDYSLKNIKIYTLEEAVRLRPGMYIGSVEQIGLINMIKGLLINTVEIFDKQTLDFEIVFLKDKSLFIKIKPERFYDIFEDWFFKSYPSPELINIKNMDLLIINPLCKIFVFQTFDKGKVKEIIMERGEKIHEAICQTNKNQSYYILKLLPDDAIFKTIDLDYSYFLEIINIFALLNANTQFTIRDERQAVLQQRYFHYPEGLKYFLSYWELNFYDKGKLKIHFYKETKNYEYEVALTYSSFRKSMIISYAENQETTYHGSLVKGILKGIKRALKKFSIHHSLGEYQFIMKDIKRNLHLVASVKGVPLMYKGATKTCLATMSVEKEIAQITFDEVFNYLKMNLII